MLKRKFSLKYSQFIARHSVKKSDSMICVNKNAPKRNDVAGVCRKLRDGSVTLLKLLEVA